MAASIKTNAILNVIKQVCQVLFPLVSIPYITRVLQPDYFGRISFSSSIVSYFALIAALGVSTYAIREGASLRNEEREYTDFVSQVFSINLLSTLLSYCFLALLLAFPVFDDYRMLIAIQSIAILLNTVGADWVNVIHEDFKFITIRYVIFQIISIICMFAFVREPNDYMLYALIIVASSAGANLLNVFHIRRYVRIKPTLRINWRKHLTPILVFFANSLAITVYVNSDITMLGFMKTDQEVGVYSLASKIYSITKQVLNAIMVVAIPRLSIAALDPDRGAFDYLTQNLLGVLATFTFPVAMGLASLSNEVLILAGGASYEDASPTLSILGATVIVSLLSTFLLSCVLIPMKKEKIALYATTLSAAINIALNFFAIPAFGSLGAAITTLFSEIAVCVVATMAVKKSRLLSISDVRWLLPIFAGTIAIGLCCFSVKMLQLPYYWTVLLSILISIPVYFIIQIILGNLPIINLLKKTGLIGKARRK